MEDPRLLDLLDKYLEQTLTDAERSELEAKLEASPDARRTFWDVADQHALMRELAAEEQGLDLARQETGGKAPGSDTSVVRRIQGLPRPSRVRRRLRRGAPSSPAWQILIAAAAAVIFIAILAVALRPQSAPIAPREIVRETPPVLPAPTPAPAAKSAPVVKRVPAPRKPEAPEPTPPGRSRAPISPELPKPAPKPEVQPPVAPPPPRPKAEPVRPKPTTVAAIAKVREVRGSATLLTSGRRMPIAGETVLTGGERIELGVSARALIEYEDGTRVELHDEGTTAVLSRRGDGGKSIRLEFGLLTADVADQKGTPLIVTTPTARARVLGTSLKMAVLHGTSRLEVTEGRVRLERTRDDVGVLVRAGHYAVAVPRGALKALPLPKTLAVIGFTLINCDTSLPIQGFEPLADGAVIDLRALPTRNLTIRADTIPMQVGSVSFYLDGKHENTERAAPYALASSSVQTYGAWKYEARAYELKATPFTGGPGAGKVGGTGTEGTSLTIRFRIVDGK